eukprot:SAG11_NODE_3089_length_2702_cov_3.781022_4_plen_86_part_00
MARLRDFSNGPRNRAAAFVVSLFWIAIRACVCFGNRNLSLELLLRGLARSYNLVPFWREMPKSRIPSNRWRLVSVLHHEHKLDRQ